MSIGTDAELTAAINEVLNRRMQDLEDGNLTKKDVRREVEDDLGLPKRSLDAKKKFIGSRINDFIASHSAEAEEEEGMEQPPKKKRKTEKKKPKKKTKKAEPEKTETGEVKKVIKCKITVAEGMVAPKRGVKDAQRNMMTGKDFEDAASPFTTTIFGNVVEAFPRSFKSGNRGWWGGGRVWIPVGDKQKVWAQLGINLTIIGSKEWQTEDGSEEEDEEE